jgi:hypothetical protein
MNNSDLSDAPANATAPSGRPGVRSGTLVHTGGVGWKQTPVEKLSNRYMVAGWDATEQRRIEKRVKERIEHPGQRILWLGYREDWRRGTDDENSVFVVALSEHQEVWAAQEREASAQWIQVKDLVVGRHVLKLALANNPWAEVAMLKPPRKAEDQSASVHELVLADADVYEVQGILLRATSVPSRVVTKRIINPLKNHPLINYVPQPRSMGMVYAEVWYRKTVALLPRCVDGSLEPIARLRAMLALKERMRDVAAKATIERWSPADFVLKHPVPVLEQIIREADELSPVEQARAAELAIVELSGPGPRHYSAFTGGAETNHVREFTSKETEYWKFQDDQWMRCGRDETESEPARYGNENGVR